MSKRSLLLALLVWSARTIQADDSVPLIVALRGEPGVARLARGEKVLSAGDATQLLRHDVAGAEVKYEYSMTFRGAAVTVPASEVDAIRTATATPPITTTW